MIRTFLLALRIETDDGSNDLAQRIRSGIAYSTVGEALTDALTTDVDADVPMVSLSIVGEI